MACALMARAGSLPAPLSLIIPCSITTDMLWRCVAEVNVCLYYAVMCDTFQPLSIFGVWLVIFFCVWAKDGRCAASVWMRMVFHRMSLLSTPIRVGCRWIGAGRGEGGGTVSDAEANAMRTAESKTGRARDQNAWTWHLLPYCFLLADGFIL